MEFGNNKTFIAALLAATNENVSPIRSKCLELFFHLSRLPRLSATLLENEDIVSTLVNASNFSQLQDRLWSLRAFQNFSCAAVGRQTIMSTTLLDNLTLSCMRKDSAEEQKAALAIIYNLTCDLGKYLNSSEHIPTKTS